MSSSKENEPQPLLEYRMEEEASRPNLALERVRGGGGGFRVNSGTSNYVTMSMIDLRKFMESEFQKERQLHKEALMKMEEKISLVLAKLPVLELRTAEVATLKNELQQQKDKQKEARGSFTDAIDKLMEEIIQLQLKNVALEERLKEMEDRNQIVMQPEKELPPPPERVQTQTGGSNGSSNTIIFPLQTVSERTEKEPEPTMVPDRGHRKAVQAGSSNHPIACVCGMEFMSETGLSVHIGKKTVDEIVGTCFPSAASTSSANVASASPVTQAPPTLTSAIITDSSSGPPQAKARGRKSDVETPHGKNPYRQLECLCGKQFTSKTTRYRHLRWYSNKLKNRDIPKEMLCCRICGKEFEFAYMLKLHLKGTHKFEKVTNADILANSYKPSNSTLEGMPMLSPAVPSAEGTVQPTSSPIPSTSTAATTCATNDQNATRSNGKPHGKDPYKRLHCFCGLKYKTNVTLYDHIRYFTGLNLLLCKPCGKRFVYASQLKLHLQQVHNRSTYRFPTTNWQNFPGILRSGRKGKERMNLTAEEIIQIKSEVPDSIQPGQFEEAGEEEENTATSSQQPGNTRERKYCVCNDVSYGAMIACDNHCQQEWFHYGCVNITSAPQGKWYCPQCRKNLPGTSASFNPVSEI